MAEKAGMEKFAGIVLNARVECRITEIEAIGVMTKIIHEYCARE